MPKPNSKSLSDDLFKSLADLQAKIEFAEKRLKKMPGAQNLIQVDVTDIFCIGYEQAPEVRWYLEFLYPLMRVSEYDWDRSTDAFDDLASSRSLSELNSATRIAVAERIPELIQLAKAGEKALARKAQNAADAIEQAFAQLDEDDQ